MNDLLKYILYFGKNYVDCTKMLSVGDEGVLFIANLEDDCISRVFMIRYGSHQCLYVGDVFEWESDEEGLIANLEWYKKQRFGI